MLAGNFYDSVMRELVFALGAALFLGYAFALVRRKADADAAAQRTVAKSRAGSPVRGYGRSTASPDLPQAPLLRTVTFMLIGFVVMIAGLAAMINMH